MKNIFPFPADDNTLTKHALDMIATDQEAGHNPV